MLTTINPYSQEEIQSYSVLSEEQLLEKIKASNNSFNAFKKLKHEDRSALLLKLADVLNEHKSKYAYQITLEMGKPIKQAISEIEKCAWVCRYYAEKGKDFLSNTEVASDASQSFLSYEPLGVILVIMPWNFPFWQVFRFLAPSLMAGNVSLIKHAPNTIGTSLMIEEAVNKAGYPSGVVQNLIIEVDKVELVIKQPEVRAVTLTGSGKAGSAVAQLAGKYIKKTVLELGGSNSFIVMQDADMEKAIKVGVTARMQNNGQSCIAAKRFMIHESVYDDYISGFAKELKNYRSGNPLDEDINLGPLARLDLAEKLDEQVQSSIAKGAKLFMGGKRDNAFFEPTILTDVKQGMPAFDEELFGPVASFMPIKDFNHAVELSNQTDFGLGVSIFTANEKSVLDNISKFEDGAVFLNDMVKSDPRLPFGGTKLSGYGRELSLFGIQEFLNIKTVYVS